MLEVLNLTKRFRSVTALDDVTLSFAAKKTHVLLGSSGSGKSTLLRIVLGLLPFQAGEVLFEKVPIHELSGATRAQRMGYVPQEGGLFPHLTAEANVALVARNLGWSRGRIQERLDELTSVFCLDPVLLERYPFELSGGQRQRVAVLRAAFLDPDLLILDEPLGALDPLIRADLQAELKGIFLTLKKTVLLVTHDIGEASFLGEQIVLMHEGRVVQKGTMADLNDHPATPFVSRFLGAQRIMMSGLK